MNGEAARLNDLAIKLAQAGRDDEALACFGRALAADPRNALAYANRAVLLANLGRREDSLADAQASLAIDAGNAAAWNTRGRVLAELGRIAEAAASFDRALALQPALLEARFNRASALRELGRTADALADYERVVALAPNFALAHRHHGEALLLRGEYARAIASLQRAAELDPRDARACVAAAAALAALKRHDEAAALLSRALALDPRFPGLRGQLYHALANVCDWRARDAAAAEIVQAVRAGEAAAAPLVMLGITDSAADQLQCARTWVAALTKDAPPMWRGERYAHSRLRVAYLSSDFDEHAVSFLLARVFELHDRSRFEVFALSSGAAATGAMRARLVAAFEHFVDVSERNDRDLAALIRSLEIDIVVDLNGHTMGSRTAALAHRPAPIAVSYLGFPGTLGAPYVDCLIADRHVIPQALEAQYAERVVVMPDTFQANDDRRAVAPRPARAQAQLAADALVLCAFANSYKITPAVFGAWMRILAAYPGSVLWLVDGPSALSANLRREASARGVDPARLVFAPRLAYAEHLARIALADLFLDTLPFNGGATLSDALWAGVPAVTCSGEAMAARMGGSLLRAAGLPDFVTGSLAAYEAKAKALVADRAALAQARSRLAQNRASCALFDSARFCRSLEAAYAAISTSSAA
jgi:predicted O-linked N-acetylglucosamine transferase (SPINDLY family)